MIRIFKNCLAMTCLLSAISAYGQNNTSSQAEQSSSPNYIVQSAESYLSNPLNVSRFLSHISTTDGHTIYYNTAQLRHQAINNLLHLYFKGILYSQTQNYAGNGYEVLVNNPAILNAYTAALKTLPPSITQNNAIMDWALFRNSYVSQPKFYETLGLPSISGNFLVILNAQSFADSNHVAIIYYPESNRLLGYLEVKDPIPDLYVFGTNDNLDLSLLLTIKALNTNPIVMQNFSSYTHIISSGITLPTPPPAPSKVTITPPSVPTTPPVTHPASTDDTTTEDDPLAENDIEPTM